MNNLESSILVVKGDAEIKDGDLQSGLVHPSQYVKPAGSVLDEEKRRILRQRARRLARKSDTEEDVVEAYLPVIGFSLGDERYAVEIAFVREVYSLRNLTPVPCTPPFIVGIINVRGQVVSVTDMKVLFGLPAGGAENEPKVLILTDQVMEMGILVDDVFGELRIPVDKIQSQMPAPKSIKQEYVRGVTQDRLVVLDAGAILCDEDIVVHEVVGD